MHKINFKTLKIVQKKIFEYDIDHVFAPLQVAWGANPRWHT
jgi:hypothetical protein